MVNAVVGYRRKNWEFAVDGLNLLDREDNDISYFYDSNPGTGVISDTHIHPIEPRMFRCRVTYRF
jgi:outer membrane receptor protein involved in Fe transport